MKSSLIASILLGLVAFSSAEGPVQSTKPEFEKTSVEDLLKASFTYRTTNEAECNTYEDERGCTHTHCTEALVFGELEVNIEKDDAECSDDVYHYRFGWSTQSDSNGLETSVEYDYQDAVEGGSYYYTDVYSTNQGTTITNYRTFNDETGQRVDRQESCYGDGRIVTKNSVSQGADFQYVERTDYADGSWQQYQSESNGDAKTSSTYYQWQGTDGSYEIESTSSHPGGFTQFYQTLDASTGYWEQLSRTSDGAGGYTETYADSTGESYTKHCDAEGECTTTE